MSKVEKGLKVVVRPGGRGHSLKGNTVAVATSGERFAESGTYKDWYFFEAVDSFEGQGQWMGPEHYDVYVEPETQDKATIEKPVAQKVVTEKAVDTKLPVKVVYAVLNKYNEILATTADREYARELKTALGGKRNGVVIYQFKANKEIR